MRAHHPTLLASISALLAGLAVSACGTTAAHSGTTPASDLHESAVARAAAAGDRSPLPTPACTQTVASVSAAASALSSAAAGAAICLSAGSYGHLELAGTHAGNVTIRVSVKVERAVFLTWVAVSQLVKTSGMVRFLQMREFVDQDGIDDPLGTLTQATRYPNFAGSR